MKISPPVLLYFVLTAVDVILTTVLILLDRLRMFYQSEHILLSWRLVSESQGGFVKQLLPVLGIVVFVQKN